MGVACQPGHAGHACSILMSMFSTLSRFPSLYFATLLMLIGTGLFNTYMGLRLSAESVSEVWIGTLISAYYFGLVLGARLGHRVIIRVGHIRVSFWRKR